MPIERNLEDGEPPKDKSGKIVPHIGIQTDMSGQLKGIGPGMPFVIIEDPRVLEKIFPTTIVSVDHKKIVLKCRCQNPECNLVYTFKAKMTGRHPPRM